MDHNVMSAPLFTDPSTGSWIEAGYFNLSLIVFVIAAIFVRFWLRRRRRERERAHREAIDLLGIALRDGTDDLLRRSAASPDDRQRWREDCERWSRRVAALLDDAMSRDARRRFENSGTVPGNGGKSDRAEADGQRAELVAKTSCLRTLICSAQY